jgi:hypothetical protein
LLELGALKIEDAVHLVESFKPLSEEFSPLHLNKLKRAVVAYRNE